MIASLIFPAVVAGVRVLFLIVGMTEILAYCPMKQDSLKTCSDARFLLTSACGQTVNRLASMEVMLSRPSGRAGRGGHSMS